MASVELLAPAKHPAEAVVASWVLAPVEVLAPAKHTYMAYRHDTREDEGVYIYISIALLGTTNWGEGLQVRFTLGVNALYLCFIGTPTLLVFFLRL